MTIKSMPSELVEILTKIVVDHVFDWSIDFLKWLKASKTFLDNFELITIRFAQSYS